MTSISQDDNFILFVISTRPYSVTFNYQTYVFHWIYTFLFLLQQMAPEKQMKIMKEFQKQSAQMDMTVCKLSSELIRIISRNLTWVYILVNVLCACMWWYALTNYMHCVEWDDVWFNWWCLGRWSGWGRNWRTC